MDEKRLLVEPADRRMWKRPSRHARHGRILAFLMLLGATALAFVYLRLNRLPAARGLQPEPTQTPAAAATAAGVGSDKQALTGALAAAAHGDPEAPAHSSSRLVPLEAHIISKCPDTLACLRNMVLPTMQRVYDKVNFTLSYIGEPASEGGVACMHGPAECMGNILELCAADLHPDPKIYLGFTMCLTYQYDAIPARSLVEDCALEHAIDIEALNACATRDDGEYAMDLLRASIARTKQAGVTKSCTVRLDNEIYCVHDGGEWISCPAGPSVNDLILHIERLYRQE